MDEKHTATAGLNDKTKRPLGQSMSLGGDPKKLAEYYGAWAETYDSDVGDTDEQYGLPGSVLVALDAATGEDVWRRPYSVRYSASYAGPHATPLIDRNDRLIAVSIDAQVHALDASTGTPLDSQPVPLDLVDENGNLLDG